MSRAVALAKTLHLHKSKNSAEQDSFSPQEMMLFVQTKLFLANSLTDSNYESLEQIESVARRLDVGGVLEEPHYVRMSQRHTAAYQKDFELKRADQVRAMMPGADNVSAASVCTKKISELRECFISELLSTSKGEPAVDRFIRLRVNEITFKTCAIQACVEDKNGTVVTIALYHMICMCAPISEAEKLLPIGTLLTIKEPYLKCSNYGTISLRVDNPINVKIVLPRYVPVRVTDSPNADSLKAEGNSRFVTGNFDAALTSYSNGIAVAQELLIALLANRAACKLKLRLFDGALQDCDAVLKLDPTHAKAAARKAQAIEGVSSMQSEERTSPPSLPGSENTRTSDAHSLKSEGNSHFTARNYGAAIDCYSSGIVRARELLIALLANRAASHLKVLDFHSALQDCEAVLKLDSAHTKGEARKELSLAGLESTCLQRQGIYDYLTMPFTPPLQSRIENYYGPIEVRAAGSKGRGLFVTRDVKVGELLFAEKAFAFQEEDPTEMILSTNFESKSALKGCTAKMNWDITMLVNKDPIANAQLSLLAYDLDTPNTTIPSMDNFLCKTFDPCPVLSAKRVSQVTNINSFSFSFVEPTTAERREMAASLRPGMVDPRTFYVSYQNRLKKASKSRKDVHSYFDGSALWILGSFMNHSKYMSVCREFFGKMMFVHARYDLRAGEELTTSYSDSEETLKKWRIYE